MNPRVVEMRAVSLRAGLQGSLLLVVAVGGWCLATFDGPHRTPILAVLGVFALVAAVAARIPAERITRHEYVDQLYTGWSVLAIAGTSTAVAVDGPGLSPLAVAYVVPLIFAALAYPLRLVVGVALLDAAACAATLALATDLPAGDVGLVSALLLIAAYLCAVHAHAHARHAAEAERLSRTDVLTACLNRRGFEEELARRIARHERYGTPFGLVVFDLDAFKDVNDRLGHSAGDELLRRVAASALDTVRSSDAVCRIGGDEFAVLLDGADADTAAQAAARLRARLTETAPVSVGWASCPDDATDGAELYGRADACLYRHKGDPSAAPHRAVAARIAPAA